MIKKIIHEWKKEAVKSSVQTETFWKYEGQWGKGLNSASLYLCKSLVSKNRIDSVASFLTVISSETLDLYGLQLTQAEELNLQLNYKKLSGSAFLVKIKHLCCFKHRTKKKGKTGVCDGSRLKS